MLVFCPHVCVCTVYVSGVCEVLKRTLDPLELQVEMIGRTMWALKMEPQYSTIAERVLHGWPNSPVLCLLKILYILVFYIWVFCLHACMCTMWGFLQYFHGIFTLARLVLCYCKVYCLLWKGLKKSQACLLIEVEKWFYKLSERILVFRKFERVLMSGLNAP